MAILPVVAVPMNQVLQGHPTVAVPPHHLNLEHSMQQVVVEVGFACPNLQPVAVERDSAFPTVRLVAEVGFACPNLQPVVEQEFVPSQEFVVEEQQGAYPNLRPVVEQDFVHPTLLVVAEHPMYWVVVL